MTILEAIKTADHMYPNDYSNESKLRWLSDFDGKIWNDVILTHHGYHVCRMPVYNDKTDIASTELLIPAPYTLVYPLYIIMMIDMANGDTVRQENSVQQWQTAYREYTDWYNRTHMPKGRRHIRY